MAKTYKCSFTVAQTGSKLTLNGVEQTSIKVEEGSIVKWVASKDGFYSDFGEIIVSGNFVMTITLQPVKKSFVQQYYTKIFKNEEGKYVQERTPFNTVTLPDTTGHVGEVLQVEELGNVGWHKVKEVEVPTKLSQLENDVGFLTEHQDISHLATKVEVALKADKATTLAGYNIEDAYTKTEVDAKVSSVYKYKGSVETYADLPTDGMSIGDVWNIKKADKTHGIKAGDNVAWTGSEWDVLAGTVDLTDYAKKTDVSAEITRAKKAEEDLNTALTSEVSRATTAEDTLTTNLTAEIANREAADTNLDTAKEDKLTSANAGDGIKITRDASGKVIIANTNLSAEWGNIEGVLSNQTDLQTALDLKANVSDLTAETSRATEAENTLSTSLDNVETNLNTKADKATTLEGYGITDAYTKTEVDSKIASVYKFKGSIDNYSDLPTDGMSIGDVWNIKNADKTHGIKAGDNVAWTDSEWDVLAGEVDLTAYRTSADQDIIDNALKAKDVDLETTMSTLASKTEVEEGLAGKEDADQNIVKYKDFTYSGQNRKTIQLDNNNSISGIDTNGIGYNLAMLSQWNVADFGSKNIHTNLNTIPYNGINAVSVNDTDVVLTDKLLSYAMLPADDTITITQDTVTVEGINLTVNKLKAKQYDETKIKQTISEALEDTEYAINSLDNRLKPVEKFKEGALDTLVVDNPNDPISIVNNFEGTSFFIGEDYVDELGNITLENKLINQIDYSTLANTDHDITITLKNCIIDYNQYVKPSSEGVHNGGVYIVDGHTNPDFGVNVIIQNCVFKNLRNKAHGVAIQGCIQKRGVSQVSNLKTVDIRGNTFEIYDGAVASAGRGCLKIWGTTFDQIGVLPGEADQGSRPLYDYIENVERKNVLESLCYANNFYGIEPYVTKFALYDTKGNSLIYMMKGATTDKNGLGGLVPPPAIADKDKFLRGDGSWTAVDYEARISALETALASLQAQMAALTVKGSVDEDSLQLTVGENN